MMPKIAYVMTPINFGGAERVDLNFLEIVDRDQFTIVPIMFLRPWEPENYFLSEIIRLNFKYYSIPIANSTRFDLFRVARCLIMLSKIVQRESYDLIHTHGYVADLLGILVSKRFGIPIISTCHGFIYDGFKISMYNALDCYALKYFSRIITVSDPLKTILINKNVCKDKITVIENTPGVCQIKDSNNRNKSRNKFRVLPTDILVGFIGRLSGEKGIIYLIESIALLQKSSCHSYKLILIGEGPQDRELKAKVLKFGLSQKVIFAGFQRNISEWLAAIDIFVLPSLTEGTPMVLLEAMGYGVPCIASAVGGIPLVIDSGVDGILVSPEKPEEISEAIYDLCTDRKKRSFISQNAKKKIMEKYNTKEWAKRIELEYVNVLK